MNMGLCITHSAKGFLISFFQPMKALSVMILVECPVTLLSPAVKEKLIKIRSLTSFLPEEFPALKFIGGFP